MNAITAAPSPAPAVAASWASAIRSPSDDSASRLRLRVMSAVIEPTTRLATGAEMSLHFSIAAVWAGSAATSRVTAWLTVVTEERITSVVRRSSFSSVSVMTRPNEAALVTQRSRPAGSGMLQVYDRWVCPVTSRSIAGERPWAIATIGPERPRAPPALQA